MDTLRKFLVVAGNTDKRYVGLAIIARGGNLMLYMFILESVELMDTYKLISGIVQKHFNSFCRWKLHITIYCEGRRIWHLPRQCHTRLILNSFCRWKLHITIYCEGRRIWHLPMQCHTRIILNSFCRWKLHITISHYNTHASATYILDTSKHFGLSVQREVCPCNECAAGRLLYQQCARPCITKIKLKNEDLATYFTLVAI